MTAITQNLPSFVKDLGVAIIGEGCYRSLVEELNVTDVACLKYSLSKGLGIGIVAGGSIMKVPQLFLILNAQSARGLSFSAYVLETLSYAITLTYSVRNNFPFSTYGENLFLSLQNVIITFLIVIYSRSPSSRLLPLALGTVATTAALYLVPAGPLALLQVATLPLSLFSKLPQIRQNSRAQSTGQLSAFAVVSQILGCLARLFTTATEVGDNLVSAGFALALLLNCVLGAQLWMYWGKDGVQKKKEDAGFGKSGEDEKKVETTSSNSNSHIRAPIPVRAGGEKKDSRPASPAPAWQQRVATPPVPSSPSGRKWARKLD